MIRLARLAAVVAPVLGLAALWVQSDRTYHTGTEWEVPIMGYDPRDYLRGHYVEFSYDWPGSEDRSDIVSSVMCLEGKAPNITRVRWLWEGQACDHPVRENGVSTLTHGRLYIGQARAAQLEEELRNRDQRGIVTIRQREDGNFTPVSIRFRPLTATEIAERDAPPESPFDPLGPPAVMGQ